MPQMPVLYRFWKTSLSLSQQKQDSLASPFKTHLSWVEVQVEREALGDGVVLVPEWYWVMETHDFRRA